MWDHSATYTAADHLAGASVTHIRSSFSTNQRAGGLSPAPSACMSKHPGVSWSIRLWVHAWMLDVALVYRMNEWRCVRACWGGVHPVSTSFYWMQFQSICHTCSQFQSAACATLPVMSVQHRTHFLHCVVVSSLAGDFYTFTGLLISRS